MIRTKETQLLMLPDEADEVECLLLQRLRIAFCCIVIAFHAEGKEKCALQTNREDYKYQKRELELCFTLQSR